MQLEKISRKRWQENSWEDGKLDFTLARFPFRLVFRSLIFLRHFIDFFIPNPDQVRYQNRGSLNFSEGQGLLFEPSFMVCVTLVMRACVCLCLLRPNLYVWLHDDFFTFSQKYNDCKFIPHLIPPNPALRALLVFHKDDTVSDAMTRSCERLNIEASRAKTTELALETFQSPTNGGHHLVIVDGRCKNIDFESFGRWVEFGSNWSFINRFPFNRSLRSSKGSAYTTMVAVVKKRWLDSTQITTKFYRFTLWESLPV